MNVSSISSSRSFTTGTFTVLRRLAGVEGERAGARGVVGSALWRCRSPSRSRRVTVWPLGALRLTVKFAPDALSSETVTSLIEISGVPSSSVIVPSPGVGERRVRRVREVEEEGLVAPR